MKNKFFTVVIILAIALFLAPASWGQQQQQQEQKYEFKIDCQVKRTPAKSQGATSTCWCFAGTSLLESECIRKTGQEIELSEMFTVRHVYPRKADNFIRLRGAATFGGGSMPFHVPMSVMVNGIVPDEVYSGLQPDQTRHNHRQLHTELQATLEPAFKTGITQEWQKEFTDILDKHLGEPPQSFKYNGKTYTPQTFAQDALQLDMNDYIVISSFTHHPFYQRFRLEVNDNFDYYDDFYNVPLDELEQIADYALKNGYSFVWNGDISEPGWKSRQGYAVIDDPNSEDPGKELKVNQEIRQEGFDHRKTTDDHAMHTVGLAHDQEGNKYYLTKNSSGSDGPYEGHVYISCSYTRAKMLFMVVNRNAVPQDFARKLRIIRR